MLKIKSYDLPNGFHLVTEVDPDTKLLKRVTRDKVIHSTVDDEYVCFVESTSEPGVYSYGAKQLQDGFFHSAGYVWSSRCSVMNKLFDIRITEVVINGCSYGMDVDVLCELMNKQYPKYTFYVDSTTDKSGEVRYFIKQKM